MGIQMVRAPNCSFGRAFDCDGHQRYYDGHPFSRPRAPTRAINHRQNESDEG
jgi:hypothetical protein